MSMPLIDNHDGRHDELATGIVNLIAISGLQPGTVRTIATGFMSNF